MSRGAWGLAAVQHGLLTRRNLLELGFGTRSIEHRVKSGRLHRVMRGVYAVGRPEMSQEQRWMAAVLACGEGALLSDGSAGELWGILPSRVGPIDVTVPRQSCRRRPGVRVRLRPGLGQHDATVRNRIPLTKPSRTLVDLAVSLSGQELERAVNEADKRDLIDPEALRKSLARYHHQPGVAVLRRLLDRDTFRHSDSELEIRFRRITAAAGPPIPLTKVFVGCFEVDFFWPQLGLVVETDGLRYHRTASSQARDRLRDQTHVAAGVTTLRFTDWQVRFEPSHVTKILVRTSERLRLE